MQTNLMLPKKIAAQPPHPRPDGTTSHSTKPASGQVAGYLPHAGEGNKVSLREEHDSGLYAKLVAHSAGLPNGELFAQMISSQIGGIGALPPGLGLDTKDFAAMLANHFPGVVLDVACAGYAADPRVPERDDVLALLLEHRAHRNMSEQWMAEIVTAACMANDHLWQDLGLWSRDYLSRLMKLNFPALAAKNVHDMKWKKFIYKQLCEKEDIKACRAPSCEYCTDYLNCFGPEE